MMERGPAWLGIGAQRCGTTWFTDLLLQHPEMRLSKRGRKELHQLYHPLTAAWDDAQREAYLDLFGDGLAGEFTPAYLRSLWTVPLAVELTRSSAPLIVLLRDPVERFESAMRLHLNRGDLRDPSLARMIGNEALWAGMYAQQLDRWQAAFGERLLVFQYERVGREPQAAVDRVWRYLGLEPVALHDVSRPSQTTSAVDWSLEGVPGLREQLRALYAQDVGRLHHWSIDLELWPNFGREGSR